MAVVIARSTNPETREAMAAAGFRGRDFDGDDRVKLLRAERRLVLAAAALHERAGSSIDGVFGLDYDVLMMLVHTVDRTFRDTRAYRRVVSNFEMQRRMNRQPAAALARVRQGSAQKAQALAHAERCGTIRAQTVQAAAEQQRALSAEALERT